MIGILGYSYTSVFLLNGMITIPPPSSLGLAHTAPALPPFCGHTTAFGRNVAVVRPATELVKDLAVVQVCQLTIRGAQEVRHVSPSLQSTTILEKYTRMT